MKKETLYRFFEGVASAEERKAIKDWLETTEENREELFREREFFDALILSDETEKAAKRIALKKNRIRRVLTEVMKIAAVVAAVLAVDSYRHIKMMDKQQNAFQAVQNTVTVPAGQRANLRLSDGTNVWLNARTTITYPAFFTGSNREIRLDGEAYFEVESDPAKPFIVHTTKYDVEVLGTSFNVEAYEGSAGFETALMEGEILVYSPESPRKIRLTPGYKATDIDGALTTGIINDHDIYRWKEGLICFKDMKFPDLMKEFEKCYGTRIVVENKQIDGKVFSGKFRISDGIVSALRVLQKEGRYTFEHNSEENTVFIR
ncbi:MAG: FecR family protein [Tannerellaceae bacterium]|jgi:ferric-dicitrate binding protein FerR (iron transport regulator)|nr:FecR family protein [Tannerellaceae bacterium]